MQSRVEGHLKDLGGVPRFEGQLAVQAPMPRGKGQKGEAVRADMKADVIADAKAATFDQIEIAFDSAARPQTSQEQARWRWAGTARSNLDVSSHRLGLISTPFWGSRRMRR